MTRKVIGLNAAALGAGIVIFLVVVIPAVLGFGWSDSDFTESFAFDSRSPDGGHVAFVGIRSGHRWRTETVLLATSKEDRSTWTQLVEWGAFRIRELKWVEDHSLVVRGQQVADVLDPSAMLSESDGISIRYEMRDMR